MALAPNFSAMLKKPMGDIERPKPYPVGTYYATVQGMPRFDKSTKKGTDFVEFTLALTGVGEDVDQEALGAMGGFQGKTIKATFYVTENSLWRLKDFLVALGLEDEADPETAISKSPGCQLAFAMVHEPSQDGESVFAKVGKPIKVE